MTTRLEQDSQAYKRRQYEEENGDGNQNQLNGNGKIPVFPTHVLPQSANNNPPAELSTPNTSHTYQKLSVPLWQRLSLKTKATAVAIACCTLPLITFGAIAYYLTNQKITEGVVHEQQDHVISLANEINHFSLERYKDVQTIAQMGILSDPRIRTAISEKEKQTVLDRYLEKGYDNIAVADLAGNTILQSAGHPITGLGTRDYFQQALKTNRPVITPPRRSALSNEYVIFAAAPIIDTATGKTIGVVRTRTPVTYLNQVIQTEAKEIAENNKGFESHENFAFNDIGKVFVATSAKYIGKDAQTVFPHVAGQLKAADEVGSVVDTNQVDGKQYIVSYAPTGKIAGMPELNWGAIVAEPTVEAFATRTNLLLMYSIGTVLLTLLVGAIAAYLVNRALRPIMKATNALQKLGQGQLNTRVAVEGEDELAVLGSNINVMADQLQTQLQKQDAEAERLQLFTDITLRIRQSLNLEDILKTSVKEIRKVFKTERVVIYRFNPDWSGSIVAESVSPGWTQSLNQQIDDSCFKEHEHYVDQYKNGRVRAIDNIHQAGLTDCYIRLLERFEVKANLVAPVLKENRLLGLMIAHQCSAPRAWQQAEIDLFTQLAIQVGFAVDQANLLEQVEKARQTAEVVSQEQRQQKEALQLFADIALRIRQSLNLEEILKTAVKEIRKVLKTDRVVVYHLDDNCDGAFIAESVAVGLIPMQGVNIYDPCFKERHAQLYKQGRVRAINDIYQEEDLTDCHIKTLEKFEVKANLVVPILVKNQLFGLLIAHQCSSPRTWQQSEISLFSQVATQVGVAINQAKLIEQLEVARTAAEAVSLEQSQQKENLQRQLVELLTNIEGATSGDLTVRAEVTAGEIGTVADIFNAIVESLRQLVTSVKKAATQVNVSVGENSGAIRQLADEAFKQAEDITSTLDSVEQMTQSIQAVADSARQAAVVARTASTTAEAGGTAMDRTVQSILNLRETVAETANKVKRLGESSQQISKVVFLINQIALQTNVLAINASIEAARAGEAGRGFAVVAEEVGGLAAQSGAATREIEQIVENIQRETSEVVQAMELGNTQVIEGTHLVKDTKNSLEQILDVSRQIDHLVQSISTATVSQARTAEAVTQLMKAIAKVSERTSNSSRQVSSSLEQTVEVAQQLQSSVGAFKVGTEG